MDEETKKTKSFNELHSSSNDVHDDFPITSRGWYLLLHLCPYPNLQSWIQNTYIRPKIKAQIDEELNHENIVLPQRTTPRKTAQKATQQETFAQRQNKPGGRNAGKQNRR